MAVAPLPIHVHPADVGGDHQVVDPAFDVDRAFVGAPARAGVVVPGVGVHMAAAHDFEARRTAFPRERRDRRNLHPLDGALRFHRQRRARVDPLQPRRHDDFGAMPPVRAGVDPDDERVAVA